MDLKGSECNGGKEWGGGRRKGDGRKGRGRIGDGEEREVQRGTHVALEHISYGIETSCLFDWMDYLSLSLSLSLSFSLSLSYNASVDLLTFPVSLISANHQKPNTSTEGPKDER